MCLYRVVIVFLVILVTIESRSEAYKHKGVLQDDDVFSKCQNQGQNVLDVHGLVDLSDFNIAPDFYKITMSGNATLVWDIQPTDRIDLSKKCATTTMSWTPVSLSLAVTLGENETDDRRIVNCGETATTVKCRYWSPGRCSCEMR
ncbi:hypothetical protein ACLKA6_009027 [Drosophila palustris]